MSSIGERILYLRNKLNLSQKELAEKVGITEASLSRYENNLREPRAEIITRIAQVLECSTDYLLGRISEDEENTSAINKIDKNSINYKNYKEIEEKILNKLINENVIDKDEILSEETLNKIIMYGINAAIEILKLEKKIK